MDQLSPSLFGIKDRSYGSLGTMILNQKVLIDGFGKIKILSSKKKFFDRRTDRPTDQPTDRPTDRPTNLLIEAPCRSLKKCDIKVEFYICVISYPVPLYLLYRQYRLHGQCYCWEQFISL